MLKLTQNLYIWVPCWLPIKPIVVTLSIIIQPRQLLKKNINGFVQSFIFLIIIYRSAHIRTRRYEENPSLSIILTVGTLAFTFPWETGEKLTIFY